MLCVLKSLLAWIAMMLVIRNLTGFTLQVIANKMDVDAGETLPRLKLTVTSTLFALLTMAVIGALYHYWNWILALAGLMIWAGAVPEQLWSAQTGRHTREALKTKLGDIGTLLTFGAIPVVWYSLCQL